MKHHQQQLEDQQSDHNSYDLHSLHKSSTSKIMKMKSLSALTPPLSSSGAPQPKVYKVKPIHFRELVQKLTGARSEHPQPLKSQTRTQTQTQTQTQARPNYRQRSNNLQSIAPPPLPLLHQPHHLQLQNQTISVSDNKHGPCKIEKGEKTFTDNSKVQSSGVGTTELILSPNFQAWFSFAMLSPGTAAISQLDQ